MTAALRFSVLMHLHGRWMRELESNDYGIALNRLHRLREQHPGRVIVLRDAAIDQAPNARAAF